jgi:hypothetical protein
MEGFSQCRECYGQFLDFQIALRQPGNVLQTLVSITASLHWDELGRSKVSRYVIAMRLTAGRFLMKTWNELGRPIKQQNSDFTDVPGSLGAILTSWSAKHEQKPVVLGQPLAQLGFPFVLCEWHRPAPSKPRSIGPRNTSSAPVSHQMQPATVCGVLLNESGNVSC